MIILSRVLSVIQILGGVALIVFMFGTESKGLLVFFGFSGLAALVNSVLAALVNSVLDDNEILGFISGVLGLISGVCGLMIMCLSIGIYNNIF